MGALLFRVSVADGRGGQIAKRQVGIKQPD